MEFVPFYLGCLAHASYLIGDRASGTAVVIDPQRDIAQYLEAASQRGLTIRHVILTHFHADFVAGHVALRAATGATIHLGAGAVADYSFSPLADGQELVLGPTVTLRTLATPGHTPEGITLLVVEQGVITRACTGDTLFIGDVGRPDLLASLGATAAGLAADLYASLARVRQLPDAVEVWPAHGAGSLCGKRLGAERFSTIGAQRALNWALQPQSQADFISQVTADQPPAPAYFVHDVQANRRADVSLAPVLPPLDAVRFQTEQDAGAWVLDVRDGAAVAGGRIPGALAIGLAGAFAPTVGQLVDPAQRLLIVADPGREAEAGLRLARIGYDHLAGFLAGGMAAWGERPLEVLRRYPAPALLEEMATSEPPLIVDVRTPGERAPALIVGSLSMPLGELASRWHELPSARRIVVHCAGGYRSLAAATFLSRHGFDAADLVGGYAQWALAVKGGVAAP
jgi:glyoxylase-like metal-dependent hydrolase (beta-lactamase superfamily II)